MGMGKQTESNLNLHLSVSRAESLLSHEQLHLVEAETAMSRFPKILDVVGGLCKLDLEGGVGGGAQDSLGQI